MPVSLCRLRPVLLDQGQQKSFYILKDYKKGNKEVYVTDTLCGLKSLNIYCMVLYRKKLTTLTKTVHNK
jgi:hypothetical protein